MFEITAALFLTTDRWLRMHLLSQILCSSTHIGHWTAPLAAEYLFWRALREHLLGKESARLILCACPVFPGWCGYVQITDPPLQLHFVFWSEIVIFSIQIRENSFHWGMETHFILTAYLNTALGFSTPTAPSKNDLTCKSSWSPSDRCRKLQVCMEKSASIFFSDCTYIHSQTEYNLSNKQGFISHWRTYTARTGSFILLKGGGRWVSGKWRPSWLANSSEPG